jgi:hypothetical protein
MNNLCLECEKKNFVKCVKSVQMKGTEVFTKDKNYRVFSWYSDIDECYILSAINNYEIKHTISEGNEEDMLEFSKDEWFVEHFKLILPTLNKL